MPKTGPDYFNSNAKPLVDELLRTGIAMAMHLPVQAARVVIKRIAHLEESFYIDWRIGKGGEIFPMVKLPTMVPGSDQNQPDFKDDTTDTRIPPICMPIRVAHIDEAPQATFNARDMHAVASRPINEHQRDLLEASDQVMFHTDFYPRYTEFGPGMASASIDEVNQLVARGEHKAAHIAWMASSIHEYDTDTVAHDFQVAAGLFPRGIARAGLKLSSRMLQAAAEVIEDETMTPQGALIEIAALGRMRGL